MKNHTFLLGLLLVIPMTLGLSMKNEKIILVLLQEVKQSDVAVVKRALKTYYKADLTQLQMDSIPANLYYNKKDTLDAYAVLDYLEALAITTRGNVVALTEKAITVGNGPEWAIRGLTRTKSHSLVSTFKVKIESKNQKEYRINLSKVARHEYGHQLGLEHCLQSTTCLMREANREQDAFFRMGQEMCPQCKEKVSSSLN